MIILKYMVILLCDNLIATLQIREADCIIRIMILECEITYIEYFLVTIVSINKQLMRELIIYFCIT